MEAASRTGWGDPVGLDFAVDASALRHPCPELGPGLGLPARPLSLLRLLRAGEKGQSNLCQVKLQLQQLN